MQINKNNPTFHNETFVSRFRIDKVIEFAYSENGKSNLAVGFGV